MDTIVAFLQDLENTFQSITVSFVNVINYLLFFAAIILAVTTIATERRGENIGFNVGRWALLTFISAAAITLAKEVFNIAV